MIHVIGTAGHVDHGKSTLVAALTGTHPDRLKEEIERAMTIDLGFAWLELPGGEEAGFVDVPGHRDFIENMLAGVGGIDAVLFVIAADEGIMPQTREHLAILDLLKIQRGILVVTKKDLVDEEWLSLLIEEIRKFTKNTCLESFPVSIVSARTGEGLAGLKQQIQDICAISIPRPDLFRPRLPVDRVFTMQGFGTIVTGTLLDGAFKVGDEVLVLPSGKPGKIRGLQTHKRKVDEAQPGNRTAVNLSGINVSEIHRGDVLCLPRQYETTRRVDVSVNLLPDAESPLAHNQNVKIFHYTTETMARVRVLGKEKLSPGETGWLQLELEQPLVMVRGDRFILRRPSPGETIGGGDVINPQPQGRYRRFSENVLAQLLSRTEEGEEAVLLHTALRLGITSARDLITTTQLERENGMLILKKLLKEGQILALDWEGGEDDDALVVADEKWREITAKMRHAVEAYHNKYPLRRGIPREELKSRLNQHSRVFNGCLEKWEHDGEIKIIQDLAAFPAFKVVLNAIQQKSVDQLLADMKNSPFSTPSVKECILRIGVDVYNVLVAEGTLFPVSEEVLFRREDFQKMRDWVVSEIRKNGSLTVIQFRDHFQTSRKYALALLEYLDKEKITRREGDFRKLF